MSEATSRCANCGAHWPHGETCESAFHQCLAWEWEEPQERFAVHPLLVLCYHLQHPQLYSSEGLILAISLLAAFLDGQLTTAEIRQGVQQHMASDQRDFSLRAGQTRGAYPHAPVWQMTLEDVLQAGAQNYPAQVRRWANSVYDSLQAAGQLPASGKQQT